MINKKSATAVSELVFASILWGFGFIASVWALKAVDAFELTFLRFALASLLSFMIVGSRLKTTNWRAMIGWSFWPAVFLFGTLVFQTWGLHYTTATKCGFITTLYVVFVPILESVHLKRKISWRLWSCVGAALLGTLLIVNVQLDSINFGDVLTFVCALFAALQIYYMSLISPKVKAPFTFNAMQAGWCLVFSLPFLLHDGLPSKVMNIGSWPVTAIVGVASLAFCSTVLAFFLQVKAQASLPPTVSSLLCLLESPFALLFAMLLLSETLGPLESLGALLIFLSAIAASYLEKK